MVQTVTIALFILLLQNSIKSIKMAHVKNILKKKKILCNYIIAAGPVCGGEMVWVQDPEHSG